MLIYFAEVHFLKNGYYPVMRTLRQGDEIQLPTLTQNFISVGKMLME